MSRKIIYFINPISGNKKKSILVGLIIKKTAQQNLSFEILYTNAEGNYNYLIKKINAEKITDVIVCGGDGTVNQIAHALLGININIGIIPMGSGNGLAFTAKIPKKIDRALDIIFKGNAVTIDAFYINKKFSCMLCGLGFDAKVAHDFAKQKKRGLATYVKQTLKNFFSIKAYPFKLEIDGENFSTEAFFISIANSNQFGNNFTIAPKASLQDGLLDIVVVNKVGKLRLLRNMIKQISKGKINSHKKMPFANKSIYYFQTKKINISNPNLAPLHIDGDPAKTELFFEIKIIEKAFRLLQP